jgi:hypothetical protein
MGFPNDMGGGDNGLMANILMKKTKYPIPDLKNPVLAYELITKLGWEK